MSQMFRGPILSTVLTRPMYVCDHVPPVAMRYDAVQQNQLCKKISCSHASFRIALRDGVKVLFVLGLGHKCKSALGAAG
jgi:hypothetical protein